MKRHLTILEVMEARDLFYPWFKRRLLGFGGDSWEAWKVFLAVAFGLPLNDKQLAIFRKYTGRTTKPVGSFDELWAIAGRGAGKSVIAALIITYVACFMEHPNLVPGETAMAICMASDKNQARVVMSYVLAFFNRIPLLASMEESRTKESITLKSGIIITVIANDYRTVRGRSLLAVVCDEISFWAADELSASPDVEVLAACRPGLARVPNSKLICISSPYGEKGCLFKAWKNHYGRDASDVLVWMSDTKSMNPTTSQSVIDRALSEDPERASAEYGFSFRCDLASFLTRACVEAAVDSGVTERSPGAGFGVDYRAFVDASGGRGDSFTAAIAHFERTRGAILDLIMEFTPPFSPREVVKSICETLKRYGIDRVVGDQYGAELTVEHFNDNNVSFTPSDKNRSEIYLNFGRAIRSRQVVLLDHERLVNQLVGLQLRTGTQGHDQVDHGHGAHDDIANSAAGALLLALSSNQALGALDYFSSGMAAKELERLQSGLQRAARPSVVTDSLKCPTCGQKENIRELSYGGEVRCQNDGTQWWPNGRPSIYRGGNRRSR